MCVRKIRLNHVKGICVGKIRWNQFQEPTLKHMCPENSMISDMCWENSNISTLSNMCWENWTLPTWKDRLYQFTKICREKSTIPSLRNMCGENSTIPILKETNFKRWKFDYTNFERCVSGKYDICVGKIRLYKVKNICVGKIRLHQFWKIRDYTCFEKYVLAKIEYQS